MVFRESRAQKRWLGQTQLADSTESEVLRASVRVTRMESDPAGSNVLKLPLSVEVRDSVGGSRSIVTAHFVMKEGKPVQLISNIPKIHGKTHVVPEDLFRGTTETLRVYAARDGKLTDKFTGIVQEFMYVFEPLANVSAGVPQVASASYPPVIISTEIVGGTGRLQGCAPEVWKAGTDRAQPYFIRYGPEGPGFSEILTFHMPDLGKAVSISRVSETRNGRLNITARNFDFIGEVPAVLRD